MSENENLELQKLFYFDTLHDFWKERKLVKNDEEDEDDEPIDNTKQEKLQKFLVEFLYKFINNDKITNLDNYNLNDKIKDLLISLTDKFVTSITSKYERSIVKYYEKKSVFSNSLYYDTSESITYGEIITAWDDWEKKKGSRALPKLWEDYKNSYGFNNILEISVGQDTLYTSYGMVQKMGKEKIVANFVLNYMFPEFTLASKTGYITFDAKTGIVGKIFRYIDNVYNLITPANIADSAPTSFTSLNNRNDFAFPSDNNIYKFDSNIYTKKNDKVLLSFENNNFSNKNPYGFKLKIQKQGLVDLTFPFSASQKQGPSVNYLVDLILDPNNAAPKVSTIINIANKNKNDTYSNLLTEQGLPLDIKRSGDYEQVNCAFIENKKKGYVIMSTIDILCSLYSRLNKQNTILHVNENLSLFRFTTEIQVDEKNQEAQKTKYESIKTIQSLEILKELSRGNIYSDINSFKDKLKDFIDRGKFYDKTIKRQNNELSNLENIMTNLIKIKMIDMLESLNKLNLNSLNITESINILDDYTSILDKYIENPTEDKLEDVNRINNEISQIDVYKNVTTLSKIFNLTTNQQKVLNKGGNILELNYDFYKETGPNLIFNYTGECKTLNFSNKLYAIIFDILSKFDRIIHSKSSRKIEQNLYNNLHLMDYFTSLNLIMNSYNNPELGEKVYNALQPEKTDTSSVKDWYTGLSQNLYIIFNTASTSTNNGDTTQAMDVDKTTLPSDIGVTTQKNSKKRLNRHELNRDGYTLRSNKVQKNEAQEGGDGGNIVQYYNLSDLLREISGISAYFLESIITTDITTSDFQLNNLDGLIEKLKSPKYTDSLNSTISKIKFIWLNGIMSIQNNIDDSYTYTPTSSEYIIFILLSMYYNTDTNSNDIDDLLDDVSKEIYEQIGTQSYIRNIVGGVSTRTSKLTTERTVERKRNQIKPSASIKQQNPRMARGLQTQSNDIYDLILRSNTPAEIIIIIVLTLIDNTMQEDNDVPQEDNESMQQDNDATHVGNKEGYFFKYIIRPNLTSNFFDNETKWNDLPRYIYSYVSCVINKKFPRRELRNLLGGKKTLKKVIKRNNKTIRKYKNKNKKTIKYKNKNKKTIKNL
jgi:hypothetical protein